MAVDKILKHSKYHLECSARVGRAPPGNCLMGGLCHGATLRPRHTGGTPGSSLKGFHRGSQALLEGTFCKSITSDLPEMFLKSKRWHTKLQNCLKNSSIGFPRSSRSGPSGAVCYKLGCASVIRCGRGLPGDPGDGSKGLPGGGLPDLLQGTCFLKPKLMSCPKCV